MRAGMHGLVVVVAVSLSAGCATQPADVDAHRPDAVHWVRNSAEHRAAYEQAYRLAAAVLARRVSSLPAGTKWAVALDADETILDNSLYQQSRGSLGFSPESWNDWIGRKAAAALPGAREFLERVHASGGTIAIVTDRSEAAEADTRANLESEGLAFDLLLCKPATGDDSKAARWKGIEDGTAASGIPPLRLVMWLGDNIRDFPDGSQSTTDAAFYAEFGEAYFVLPNPMYGSWESNLRR